MAFTNDRHPLGTKIERALYRGNIVTVLKRNTVKRTVEIRDAFGFVETVPKKEVKPLREDDERREFHVT